MFNRYTRLIIINLIKMIIPVSMLFLIAPQLVHINKTLNEIQIFLSAHQIIFLISHLLFYVVVYLLWPKIVQVFLFRKKHTLAPAQIHLVLSARLYLLGILLFIELLIWWR